MVVDDEQRIEVFLGPLRVLEFDARALVLQLPFKPSLQVLLQSFGKSVHRAHSSLCRCFQKRRAKVQALPQSGVSD